jgi:hypothetical protein
VEAGIKIYLDMRSYFSLGRQFVVGLCDPTTIHADHDLIKHVDMGWTREIWVFVNGKLALQSKNLYGIKGASKEPGGRLSLTNGSFDLALQKGANQVVVAIDDNFAGGQQHWGWGWRCGWQIPMALPRRSHRSCRRQSKER